MTRLNIFISLAIRAANFSISKESAISRSLAICPSPLSRSWLTVHHKVLLVGFNVEKLRCAGLLRIVCSRKYLVPKS
jgi:hypothetical protein